MSERITKLSYRICCALVLVFSIVVLLDLQRKGDLNVKLVFLVIALLVLICWGLYEWKKHSDVIKRQANVIKTYRMYVRPLEELTKEIRARQHEFDNHLNAVLNMHIMIDNYDELVEKQSQYIKEMYIEDSRQLIALLKISDKILAGFLYSKIIAAPKYLDVNLQVRDFEIISTVPEHDIIEVIGTLVDNAYEASSEEMNDVDMILDSEDNKVYFEVRNQVKDMNFNKMAQFFKKGYSTKGAKRGLGLHNARRIANKYGGDITVELMELYGKDYISFKVEL